MRFSSLRAIRRVFMVFFPVAGLGSSAWADPLTTFAVTDLGAGYPLFGTDASGRSTVMSSGGQTAYSFQPAQESALNPQQLLASGFPMNDAAPPSYAPGAYGDPSLVYSTLLNAGTNGNGVFAGIDAYGVNGHEGNSTAYFVKQSPDGTWGTPVGMWTGGVQFVGLPDPGQASITGINKLNEILGMGVEPTVGGPGLQQAYLYSVATNSLLDLSTLNVLQSGGWGGIRPVAIDDQGRILLEGWRNSGTGGDFGHTLLLTPEGVSSDPVAAPEPGALALAAITLAALALRGAVRARA